VGAQRAWEDCAKMPASARAVLQRTEVESTPFRRSAHSKVVKTGANVDMGTASLQLSQGAWEAQLRAMIIAMGASTETMVGSGILDQLRGGIEQAKL
jgi:hypothetical protein